MLLQRDCQQMQGTFLETNSCDAVDIAITILAKLWHHTWACVHCETALLPEVVCQELLSVECSLR